MYYLQVLGRVSLHNRRHYNFEGHPQWPSLDNQLPMHCHIPLCQQFLVALMDLLHINYPGHAGMGKLHQHHHRTMVRQPMLQYFRMLGQYLCHTHCQALDCLAQVHSRQQKHFVFQVLPIVQNRCYQPRPLHPESSHWQRTMCQCHWPGRHAWCQDKILSLIQL